MDEAGDAHERLRYPAPTVPSVSVTQRLGYPARLRPIHDVGHNHPMGSPLSNVPIGMRRRAALTVGLFAALFVAIGAVSATGRGSAAPVFAAIAFVVAVLLALIAWGTQHSIKIDSSDEALDRGLEAALAEFGVGCGCGHDHDPDELHVTDAPPAQCAHDGHGATCSHDCQTCVLATMRAPGT